VNAKPATRRVTAPTGIEWRVRRRWVSRRLPRLRHVSGDAAGDVALGSGNWLPVDVGGLSDLEGWLVVVIALVVIVFVLIPLLLFGIELIIVGVVLATGMIGRLFLGHPWIIEANSNGGQVLTWQVSGWRHSRRALDEVARALAVGREPSIAGGRDTSRH
jgi:hypothetical protein